MRFPRYFIALLLLWSLAACATQPPRHRSEAAATLDRVKRAGGEILLPAQFQSVLKAFQAGELLLMQKEREDAESYYYLALLKGALLEEEVRAEGARQNEAARLAEEQKRAELERLAQVEARRLAQARAEALAQKEALEFERMKAKPQPQPQPQPQKDNPLVLSHRVKRGESLPLIASHPEVYGDRNLWPLIYRANRDQISDPRHIWPGQVLRIPRNAGRDDTAEARRYSQERPLN